MQNHFIEIWQLSLLKNKHFKKGIFGLFSNIKWTSFEPWVFTSIYWTFKQNVMQGYVGTEYRNIMAKELTYATQWYIILITLLGIQNPNGFIDISIAFCPSLK